MENKKNEQLGWYKKTIYVYFDKIFPLYSYFVLVLFFLVSLPSSHKKNKQLLVKCDNQREKHVYTRHPSHHPVKLLSLWYHMVDKIKKKWFSCYPFKIISSLNFLFYHLIILSYQPFLKIYYYMREGF